MARILVTRPEPGASATAQRLIAMGHDVIVAQLFNVHSVAWSPPGELFDALMLTSANAVRLAGPLPDRWRAMPCYAVGRATAHAAASHGFSRIVTGTGDAEALGARMAGDGIGTALHLAGREHRRISLQNPRIITRVVYAAEAIELEDGVAQKLAAGGIDRVLLYSARAAARFAALADRAGWARDAITLGTLSDQVAAAAGKGWRAVSVATAPGEDQLFAACGLLCQKPASAGRTGDA